MGMETPRPMARVLLCLLLELEGDESGDWEAFEEGIALDVVVEVALDLLVVLIDDFLPVLVGVLVVLAELCGLGEIAAAVPDAASPAGSVVVLAAAVTRPAAVTVLVPAIEYPFSTQ